MSDCTCPNCGPVCPTCNVEYSSQEGMLTHHAKTHGEKLTCLKRKEQEKHPCPSCDKKFTSEQGVKMHHYKTHDVSLTRVNVECVVCGEVEEVNQWRKEHTDVWTCSDECLSEHMSQKMSGREITWTEELSKAQEKYFEEHGPHMEGESHWRYKGGRVEREELDDEFKEKIRQSRDRECEKCGKHESVQERRLCVHHVDEDPSNNELDNLKVLCDSCHTSLHAGSD